MRRRFVVLIVSVLLGTSAMAVGPVVGPALRAEAPTSSYWFESDPGDPTARGRSGYATSLDSTFGSYDNGGIWTTIGISGPLGWLAVEAYGPGGEHLTPATTYEHARFSGYAGPGEATLAVHWSGEGSCNPAGSDGTLVVHDVAYDGTLFSRLSISFEFTCTGATGAYHGELRYEASDPGYTAVTQAPADASPVDFGSLGIGAVSTARTYTLTNVGAGSVSVGTASLTGDDPDDFAITADTCSGAPLAGGATCTFGVRFEPSATGARTAVLDVPVGTPLGHRRTSVKGVGLTPTTTTLDAPSGVAFQPVLVTVHTRPAPQAPPGYIPAAGLLVDGILNASGPYDENGDAEISLGHLPPGTYEIAGRYGGSAELAPSQSEPVTLQIGVITATSLTSSSEPALDTEPIAFTAVVTPAPPGGTLTITDTTTAALLGTKELAPGDSTLAVEATLAAGEHDVVAEYSGHATYQASTDSIVQHVTQDLDVEADGFAVSPTTFYPVADGYRDTVTAKGKRHEPISVSISVYAVATGRRVRTGAVVMGTGAYAWTWDGRNASGALQASGKYRVVQVLTDRGENTLSTTAYVTLSRKKLYWYSASSTLAGAAYAAKGRAGGGAVSTSKSAYTRGVRLASGRGWAGTSYKFTIKSAAAYGTVKFKVLGWSPNGRQGVIGIWKPTYGPWTQVYAYGAAKAVGPAYRWHSTRGSLEEHRKGTVVRAEVVAAYDHGKVVFDVAKVRIVYRYAILK